MTSTKDFFCSERLKEMIRKYAADPAGILPNGLVNNKKLEELVAKYVWIDPERRNGKACIIGTRIAVCDIIGDTLDLFAQVGFENESYGGTILREAVDAAYALLMIDFGKVATDYERCYGHSFPKELYN